MSDSAGRKRAELVRRVSAAAGAGLLLTLVGGWFAFGFSLRVSGTRKLLSSLYLPGLRVASHLHVPSFMGWFVLAGALNFLLYACLFYLLLRMWPREH